MMALNLGNVMDIMRNITAPSRLCIEWVIMGYLATRCVLSKWYLCCIDEEYFPRW